MRLALLTIVSCLAAYGQAAPTTPPGDSPTNPNVYMGKLPKVDKSRQRDIKGVVKDDKDVPIDGAIVSLKDLKTGKIVSFRTKQDGLYLFYDLNMDLDYELTASWDRAAGTVTKKLTKYDTRKKPTLNFSLETKKPS